MLGGSPENTPFQTLLPGLSGVPEMSDSGGQEEVRPFPRPRPNPRPQMKLARAWALSVRASAEAAAFGTQRSILTEVSPSVVVHGGWQKEYGARRGERRNGISPSLRSTRRPTPRPTLTMRCQLMVQSRTPQHHTTVGQVGLVSTKSLGRVRPTWVAKGRMWITLDVCARLGFRRLRQVHRSQKSLFSAVAGPNIVETLLREPKFLADSTKTRLILAKFGLVVVEI